MMLKKLFAIYKTTIYIQIWENRVKAVVVNTGEVFDEPPLVAIKTNAKGQKIITSVGSGARQDGINDATVVVNPFSHPRTLLSDFEVAEKFMQHVMSTLLGKRFLPPTPHVIIHPMEKTEGGLNMIEERALRELALGAGAREVIIYEGPQLDAETIDYETLKNELGL